MKTTTSERLKQIMNDRGLKQIDIVRKCEPYCEKVGTKIGRSALSQYVKGKYLPDQKKLTLLGLALNVNEAWLMGYDVPMGRSNKTEAPTQESVLTEYEQDIVNLVKVIPEDKREDFLKYLQAAINMMK